MGLQCMIELLHMRFVSARQKRGFTLVEIVIVVGIISLLTAVILASVSKAREQTRDKVRLSDIEQMQLTMRLYAEANNGYPSDPSYDSGVEIGNNSALATDLQIIQPSLPRDPISDTNYKYVYDTKFNCTAPDQTVIYVNAFETLTDNANADDVCGIGANDASSGQYIILLP